MTVRWILIEKNSGYIWGDSATMKGNFALAVHYAQALDESLGEHGRLYEHTGSSIADGRVAGIEGYFVYAVPDDIDFPIVENGRDPIIIEQLKDDCRRCGFIVVGHIQ